MDSPGQFGVTAVMASAGASVGVALQAATPEVLAPQAKNLALAAGGTDPSAP